MSLREQAIELANRPYIEIVRLEETTEGEPIFVARSPELEGCLAQGETVEEARVSLREARIDYIESLLEDDLPVPGPTEISVTASTSVGISFSTTNKQQGEELEFYSSYKNGERHKFSELALSA